LKRRPAIAVSPLRYPGAKRRLAGYIAALLELNDLKPKLFVEPFAGGASVALELLAGGHVEHIALGEKDSWVASFWKVVFFDTDWLIDRVENMQVTLRQWRHFKRGGFRSDRDRALACLFLNRTSFSGILSPTAGPIGGHTQASDYKIDCRFTRPTLVRRIRRIAELRDRVEFVNAGDWAATITRAQASGHAAADVFYYLDPPFYHKADRLYRHAFDSADHMTLRDHMATLKSPWLVSYDPAVEIIKLYSQRSVGGVIGHLDLLYSAAASAVPNPVREVVITSVDKLPRATRLWRSSTEWRAVRMAKAS
jgi:DNA adenine methylase